MPADLESLSALPDDQLIEKVAVEVMGWEIVRSPTGKKYDRYIRGYWPLNDGTQRPAYSYMRHWNPLTDWNHTMEVLEKVRTIEQPMEADRTKLEVCINCAHLCKDYCVEIYGRDHRAIVEDKDPQRAICISALLAVSPTP